MKMGKDVSLADFLDGGRGPGRRRKLRRFKRKHDYGVPAREAPRDMAREWSLDAPMLPRRPEFPRPQRAFPLMPINKVIVMMDTWLIVIAVVCCFVAYSDRPKLTAVPLFHSSSNWLTNAAPIFIVTPPFFIALYCMYVGLEKGWFKFLYRRWVIVSYHVSVCCRNIGQFLRWSRDGCGKLCRLGGRGLWWLVKGVGRLLLWVLRLLVRCCASACRSTVIKWCTYYSHTPCFRRWKRRLRKRYQCCALLCCWCCASGRKTAEKYWEPELSDSERSSEHSDDDDAPQHDLDADTSLELAISDAPHAGGRRRTLTFAEGPVDGRVRSPTRSALRGSRAQEVSSGRSLKFDEEALAADSKQLVQVNDEDARMLAKQQPRPKPRKLVDIPPGMLDDTEALLFYSLECMSDYVAAAYKSLAQAAEESKKKPPLWRR